MGENLVLSTTRMVIENPQYVQINYEKLDDVAARFAQEKLEIPAWDAPVFLEGDDENVTDFFFLGNSINFAFTGFETGEKYSAEYNGTQWTGAFGMWASLKKALQNSIPLLGGEYLKNIPEEGLKDVLGNIPMFDERLAIFREVGEVLCRSYNGRFHNLAKQCKKLFDNGNGLVEKLYAEFPSFDDSADFNGKLVRFDKRAQLAPAMLCGRFGACLEDVSKLTVFADYVLPKALRSMGCLEYSPSLAAKVDNRQLIKAGSVEEMEIRASTIHAAEHLIEKVRIAQPVNALHIDYKLWSEARKDKSSFHHLTRAIAY